MICAHEGCFRSGTWRDDDEPSKGYCGEHIIFVTAPTSAEVQAEKRRDNADEHRRGAR